MLTHCSQHSHDPQRQSEWGSFDAKSFLTHLGMKEGPRSLEISKSFLQYEIQLHENKFMPNEVKPSKVSLYTTNQLCSHPILEYLIQLFSPRLYSVPGSPSTYVVHAIISYSLFKFLLVMLPYSTDSTFTRIISLAGLVGPCWPSIYLASLWYSKLLKTSFLSTSTNHDFSSALFFLSLFSVCLSVS